MATSEQFRGVGRRKKSVARVFFSPGAGQLTVNGRSMAEHFPRHSHQQDIQQALDLLEQQGRFDVKVNVEGGGLTGQAGAVRLALARALVEYDAELRGVLRDKGLLTRDPRQVERKKYGRPKARKRFQFSKR